MQLLLLQGGRGFPPWHPQQAQVSCFLLEEREIMWRDSVEIK